MSRSSGNTSTIRCKRDHQQSLTNESSTTTTTTTGTSLSSNKISPPLKKSKTSPMDKDSRSRYPNGSSSPFLSSQNPSMVTKKLVIKNLKSNVNVFLRFFFPNSNLDFALILASSTTPVTDHFEKIWPLLKQALEAILTGTNSPTNEEQLYRHIDHLCTTSTNDTNPSAASQLYENLRKVLTEHIQTRVPILLR